MEKVWRKFYYIAFVLSKENSSLHIENECNDIFNYLNELRIEAQKTIELLRKNLLSSRPIILSEDQLEDYAKRIEFANEIMLNLYYLIKKTFDSYINFMNAHWRTSENFESTEQQRILSERYDMSMTEWQSVLNKIERFNEVIKNCH